MINNSKKLRTIISVCLILVVTILVFLPSLRNGFLNWDDSWYLTNNTAVKHISPANVGKIFSSFMADGYTYEPLTILSYSLEYHFFELNPEVYHLTSLVLHLFNCLLIFWLINILSQRLAVAVMVALLFGIHPLHVESVAWIADRKDVLCGFFFLSAMIAYVYHLRQTHLSKFYYLSLIFFLLALLAKPMAITLPFVLFLLDYFVGRKDKKISFANKIPFFILSLIFGSIFIFARFSLMGSGVIIHYSRLLNMLRKFLIANFIIVFYLTKLLLPIKLSCLYPYQLLLGKPWPLIFLMAPFFSMIAGFFIFIFKKTSKKAVFSALFFLITILPVLQFFKTGPTMVADRYTYIPSLGIFYGIGEGLLWFYTKKIKYGHKTIKVFLLIVLIGIIGVLGILTWRRCGIWRDDLTLWNDVLKKNPGNTLGFADASYFLSKKDYERAYTDAIGIASSITDPNIIKPFYLNLGIFLYENGENEKARGVFEKLIKLTPKDAKVYCCIGNTYASEGRHADAILFYKKAIDIDPDFGQAYSNLGNEYVKFSRFQEALGLYNKAIQKTPDYADAYDNLALLYNYIGKKGEIVLLHERAIANKAASFQAYYHIAGLYSQRGRNEEAVKLYKEALRINPDFIAAYINLGNAYCDMGKNKEGVFYYEKALKLNPQLAAVYNNLALAYYGEKKYDLAIQYCDKAIAFGYPINPELLHWLEQYRKH